MMRAKVLPSKRLCARAGTMPRLAAFLLAACYGAGAAYAAPAINVSQVPLTVTIPAHPQLIFAIGNSQSMDGTLSGAIMTGAGALSATDSLLQNSSSPVDFTVPAGFTPPLNAGSGGQAPYTVTSATTTCAAGGLCVCPAGDQCDNSASRLNAAKAAIYNVLNLFMADTDFSLMTYCSNPSSTTSCSTSTTEYETWLYVMSPTSGPFVFTNTEVAGDQYVANPCYNYQSLATTNTVYTDCHTIDTGGQVTLSGVLSISSAQYMQVSDTSDDPLVNDVLYAPNGWGSPVCLVYGGPNPPTPWPPNYSLADYNSNPGTIQVGYTHESTACATTVTPTNAGYVPYTPQSMYMARGFGYDNGNNQYHTPPTGSYWAPVVAMTSAGQYPTTATVNTAIAKFLPYLAPETNTTATSEVKAVAEQSPLAGLLKNAQAYYTDANPAPSVPGCAVQRYVVLLTDGLPTEGVVGDAWPPPGTTAASEYGETVSFNADGSLNIAGTNDLSLVETINTLTSMYNAGIKTYIVGLGSGVSANPAAAQVLTAMAIAAGTSQYFPATNTVQLTQALQTILGDVQAATQSVSSSAINSTGIHEGSVVYQAQFTTKDTNQDWTGNVFAFPINPTTGYVATNPSDALWQAQSLLDSQPWQTGGAGRIIATWDPVAGTGIPFEWSSGTPSAGIASSTTLGQDLSTNPADTNGQDALDYLRGDRALEQAQGGPYRTRTHVLGDIIDSAPIYIGPPQGLYQGSSYTTFQQTWANRPPVVYVGGNDGMLHAFDAATGIERFAFIPHAVFSNLVNLTYPTYNENHLFFVDGSPQAWDVQFSDNSWHTVLVSPEGAGGSSIFAIDVTNPAGITSEASLASSVLWEFTDGNMGLTFGPPSLALTNDGQLLFFSNGYNSPTEQPYLYALNPQDGTVVAKLSLCSFVPTACNASLPNGLSTVTLVNSTGSLSGPANVLYAGDLQGNVWRVDISNSNPANWTASVLFQATDPSGNPQPITTQPVVSLNPDFPRLQGTFVFVGTGQLLSTSDLSSTQTESLYGLYDAMPNASVITKASLVQQTLTATTVTTVNSTTVNAIQVTNNLVTLPSQMGWYVNFSLNSGERVITDPVLYSGALVITTNQPTASNCVATTDSWFYEFNYLDGGRFPGPTFDVTESGSISNSEPSVAGVSLGNVYSSGARITSGSLGNGTAGLDILINESGDSTVAGAYSSYGQNQQPVCVGGPQVCGNPITPILGKGGGQSRTAWWEIR